MASCLVLSWADSFSLLEVGGVLVLFLGAFWGFLGCLGLGVLVEGDSCCGRDEVGVMLYFILFGLGFVRSSTFFLFLSCISSVMLSMLFIVLTCVL